MAAVEEIAAEGRTLPRECTFEAEDWAILAHHWYPIALSRDIAASPIRATLLDERLVVYRAAGDVVVANDICPHRGVPLSAGRGESDGTGIRCAYHGLKFGPGGRCMDIPAHPQGKIPLRMHLRPYPVVERYGLVWTCLRPHHDALEDPATTARRST